jgi:hypothetical protein
MNTVVLSYDGHLTVIWLMVLTRCFLILDITSKLPSRFPFKSCLMAFSHNEYLLLYVLPRPLSQAIITTFHEQ